MKMLAVNHDVEDYDKWKAAFDSFPPSLGGAKFHRINRNVDNPNNLTIVMGFATVEEAKAFMNNPELKEKMEEAGVASPPRFELFEEVEVVEY